MILCNSKAELIIYPVYRMHGFAGIRGRGIENENKYKKDFALKPFYKIVCSHKHEFAILPFYSERK